MTIETWSEARQLELTALAKAAIDVEYRTIGFVSAGLVFLAEFRERDHRTVQRQSHLSAVRVAAQVEIDAQTANVLDQVGRVKQKDVEMTPIDRLKQVPARLGAIEAQPGNTDHLTPLLHRDRILLQPAKARIGKEVEVEPMTDLKAAFDGEPTQRRIEPTKHSLQTGQRGGVVETVACEHNDVRLELIDDPNGPFLIVGLPVAVEVRDLSDAKAAGPEFGRANCHRIHFDPIGLYEVPVQQAEDTCDGQSVQDNIELPHPDVLPRSPTNPDQDVTDQQQELQAVDGHDQEPDQQQGDFFSQ